MRALRAGLLRYGLLGLATVVLAAGLFTWWQAHDLKTSPAAANHALADGAATAEVQNQVSQALTAVLSYDYARPAKSKAVADDLLRGDARKEYATLVESLRKKAPDQKLVLTAQVQVSGVKELHDGTAELLVFLDQTSRRKGDNETSVSAAQLSVTAEKMAGHWRITGLEPL